MPRAWISAMVDFQSMPQEYRHTDYLASGFPIDGVSTLSAMRSKDDRSDFGKRLVAAREHAGLTQKSAAKGIMSQSTLAELERTGQGSSHTVALAARCGVRAEWLANGDLPMEAQPNTEADRPDSAAAPRNDLTQSLWSVAKAASAVAKDSRESASKLLALVVADPAGYAEDLIPIVVRQLSGEPDASSGMNEPKPKVA